jgi:hypothetical protein
MRMSLADLPRPKLFKFDVLTGRWLATVTNTPNFRHWEPRLQIDAPKQRSRYASPEAISTCPTIVQVVKPSYECITGQTAQGRRKLRPSAAPAGVFTYAAAAHTKPMKTPTTPAIWTW